LAESGNEMSLSTRPHQPSEPTINAAEPAGGRLAPLRYPVFRRAVGARALSSAGGWMQTVAAGWLMFRLTNSAAAVGAITIVSRGPGVVLSGYGGVLADRYDERRLGVWVAVLQTLAASALAATALAHEIDPIQIYIATFVIGAAGAVANPLMQDIVPRSVPPGMLTAANSISATTYTIARMIGPLAGGGLVATLGIASCFWINAASFLFVVGMFAALPREIGLAKRESGGLRVAMREARVRPLLGAALLGVGAFSVLVAPIQELAPVIARQHGSSARVVGFLLGALALGSVIGSLLVNRLVKGDRPRRYVIGAASGLAGVSIIALGLAPNLLLTIAAMVLAGFFWECFFVTAQIALELESPSELLGREMGLFYALTLGGLAIGAPLTGFLFDLTGVRVGLVISGGLMVSFDAWRLIWLRRRLRRSSS
jgi:MFS family permease